MLTPEDVRKLVRNRNARQYRAQIREEALEEEQLDFIEEAIAEYLAGEEYLDYITEHIDAAVESAVEENLPVYVGFATKGWREYSYISNITTDYYSDRRSHYKEAWAVTMAVSGIGIEDKVAIATALAETILALYQDAGWSTSDEVRGHNVRVRSQNENSISGFADEVWTYGFWLYY